MALIGVGHVIGFWAAGLAGGRLKSSRTVIKATSKATKDLLWSIFRGAQALLEGRWVFIDGCLEGS